MKLPTRHISVRVPWHDSKWNGCVCNDPINNTSCMMFLPRMVLKNPDIEERYKGSPLRVLDHGYTPPCIGEMVSFLSDKEINIKKKPPLPGEQ